MYESSEERLEKRRDAALAKSKQKAFNLDDAWAASGLPESYKDVFYANPFVGKKATGGFLGIGRSKEQEQYDLERDKYIANLQAQARQELYESPVQAAARESAAGINADLNGLDDAVSASDAEVATLGDIDFADPMDHIQTMAQLFMNIASVGMAIPREIAGYKNIELVNDAQEIANSDAIDDIAIAHASDYFNLDNFNLKDAYDENGYFIPEKLHIDASVLSDAGKTFAEKFFPGNTRSAHRLRQKMSDAVKRNANTLQTNLRKYATLSELSKAITSNELSGKSAEVAKLGIQYQIDSLINQTEVQKQLSEFYNKNHDKIVSNMGKSVGVESSQLNAASAAADANILQSQAAGAQANFQKSFYENRDASQSAKYANQSETTGIENQILTQGKLEQLQIDLRYLKSMRDFYDTRPPFVSDQNFLETLFYPRKHANRIIFHRRYEQAYDRVWNKSIGSDGFNISIPKIGNIGYHD